MWDPSKHVVRTKDLPALERLIALGIDHGITNPSAGILLGIAQSRLYAVDE